MKGNRISVKLVGHEEDNGLIRFSDFVHEVNSMTEILNKLDHLISKSNEKTMYFRLTQLSYASPATMEVEGVPLSPRLDLTSGVASRFMEGVESIKNGYAPPDFDRDLIDSYLTLGKPLNHRITEKIYKSNGKIVPLNVSLDESVKKILGEDEYSVGSVSGILELIDIHAGSNRFRIYPVAGAKYVDCYFSPSQLDYAVTGIGKNVNVEGRLKYKSKERYPRSIEVKNLEVYPNEDELPSIFELEGIAPNATGGLSSEDFVRRIRNEE